MPELAESTSWLKDRSKTVKMVHQTEHELRPRQAEAKTYLRHYYDRPIYDADYSRKYREEGLYAELKDSYGGNLTREVVDAASSIVCRPLSAEVYPRTDDFGIEQGCKQVSRLIEGVFDNSNFLALAKEAFRDGMTADLGALLGYVDEQTDEIKFERINPLELYWVEDGTGSPRTQMRISPVPRDKLAARFPAKRTEILDSGKCKRWQPDRIPGVDSPSSRREADTVKLVEVWCVALGEKNPGRHVVLVDDVILLDEEWKYAITPIVVFRWQKDFRGFAGVSLARIVSRYDRANRRLLRMLYASLSGAVPQVLRHVDDDSEGPSDMEFGEWRWEGVYKPEITVPKTVSTDVVSQIRDNYTRAYAEGGVNQNMATGSAPARYTSGAAQREFVDIANSRLQDAQYMWQDGWVGGAEVVVMLAEVAKTARVRVKGANYYEMVTFPSINRDLYKVSFGLTSGLSLTPAGRLQELSDLKDMGLADTADVARNLGLPDTRDLADRLNAPRDLIMKQISVCLDQGPTVKKAGKDVPNPFPMPSAMMDLESAIRIGSQKYQLALVQGRYPKANLEMLRRWIKACQARMAPPPAPPAPSLPAGLPPITPIAAPPGAPAPGPGLPIAPTAPAMPVAA